MLYFHVVCISVQVTLVMLLVVERKSGFIQFPVCQSRKWANGI